MDELSSGARCMVSVVVTYAVSSVVVAISTMVCRELSIR